MRKRLITALYIVLITFTTVSSGYGQNLNYGLRNQISLTEYLQKISRGNLGYIAEKFNVTISEAELEAARVFPDPGFDISYSNNQDRKIQMGQTLETGLNYNFSLGNKRGAYINMARSTLELSGIMLEAYFRNLRADAALSYYTALRNFKINQMQEEIHRQLRRLAVMDSIRWITGEGSQTDALQSAFEANAQLNEVVASATEFYNSVIGFNYLMGKITPDTLFIPSDDFPVQKKEFKLSDLLDQSKNNRSDLQAAIKNKTVNEKYLNLLKANRAFEFSVEAGLAYNSLVRNEIAPAPVYRAYSAGLSIPLKFSNLNKGPVKAGMLAVSQSESVIKDVELEITSEVLQAYNLYTGRWNIVDQFNKGLIGDAEKILNARILSYQQGETGLLDVLNAQRSYAKVRIEYLESLFQYTSAIINLERSAGIWDLSN